MRGAGGPSTKCSSRANDGAWADVELAGKLLINADVPKLAGLIAYRRKQIDVARAKFQESRERNPADCETGFYLGVVLAEQAVWDRTAEVLVATGQCLESWEHDYTSEIERLRASNDPPRRVERQILETAAADRRSSSKDGDVVVQRRGGLLPARPQRRCKAICRARRRRRTVRRTRS